jgi:APA family basic amino acid/polyamine antiporter
MTDPSTDPHFDHEQQPFITTATAATTSSINQPPPPSPSPTTLTHRCCRVKPLTTIQQEQRTESHHGNTLKRVLTMTDLVAYGLGSTLGAGLFVVAGQAAAGSGSRPAAGPAVSLSFLFAAVACLFSALCYAEFASRIPVAGSAYSFAYASLGEGVAWFIGWNLTLEYGVSAAAVARAWEQYVVEFFRLIGCPLPTVLYACPLFPFTTAPWNNNNNYNGTLNHGNGTTTNGTVHGVDPDPTTTSGFTVSMLSPFIIVVCSSILLRGAKATARFNFAVMCFNLALVFFIVVVGSSQVQPAHWSPFAPSGMRGIVDNAGFVFFSYIGFDCVCTLAEELEHPQRDLPRGIVWTLVIVTTLYVLVSLVLTGKRMFVYTCSNYVIVILVRTRSFEQVNTDSY